MTNEIKIFENPEFGQVRTLAIDENPWFAGEDVAKILQYKRPTKAIVDHVDEEDRMMLDSKTQSHFGIELGQRGGWVVNESGLYGLVLSSKLPAAKKFKRWVTTEVLPSIRKHGVYMTDETLTESLARPENLITILQTLLSEKEKTAALESQIEQEKPKVKFAEAVYDTQSLISIADLAKLLHANGVKIGQKRLYDYLREKNFLCKRPGDDWNTPTQRYLDMGLFEVKEFSYPTKCGWGISKTTKVTGKGQTYLVNYILEHKDEINSRPKMKRGA